MPAPLATTRWSGSLGVVRRWGGALLDVAFPPACVACGESTATVALGAYDGLLRRLVLQAKRPGNDRLAQALGGRLAESVRQRGFANGAVVCPTPSYWWRRFTRGANSPDAIAAGLAKGLGRRVAHPLRRSRNTAKQADLAPGRRRTNVRGAFAAHDTRLEGATVLLVDDVLTTGATLDAAARALRRAGAQRVIAVVVARRTAG